MRLTPFKLILGTPLPPQPRPWEDLPLPGVMVSAYTILTNDRLRALVRGRGLRRLLGLGDDKELWIDSGGYQFMRSGFTVTPEKLTKLYREVDADYYVSLDYPPSPGEPLATRVYKITRSVQSYQAMRSMLGDKREQLVPVFHLSWGSVLRLQYDAYSSADAAAVGGLVPLIMQLDGRYSRKRAVAFIALMRKIWGGRLHALGLASAAMIPLLRLLGVDSGDTQTWRHKAAYGKIIIPGLGERHISGRNVRFGPARLRDREEEDLLYKLAVEVSRSLGLNISELLERLRNDFITRALVNAWVLNKVAVNGIGYLAKSPVWSKLYSYAEKLLERRPEDIENELEYMYRSAHGRQVAA